MINTLPNLRALLTQQIQSQMQFVRAIIQQYYKHDGSYRSATLSFTTLFALVPFLSIALTFFTKLPHFEQAEAQFRHYIFSHFVPVHGDEVESYLLSFAQQAGQLSKLSVAMLAGSVMFLLYTIEESLNVVFEVESSRNTARIVFNYILALFSVPIFIILSVAMTTILLPFTLGWIGNYTLTYWSTLLFALAPPLCLFLGLSQCYKWVPNCHISWTSALQGAFVATCFFELGKWLLTWYLSGVNTYKIVYGTFATIPIFLLWLNFMWGIFILGAEVASQRNLNNF